MCISKKFKVIKSSFKTDSKNYTGIHGIWIFIHAEMVNWMQEELGHKFFCFIKGSKSFIKKKMLQT